MSQETFFTFFSYTQLVSFFETGIHPRAMEAQPSLIILSVYHIWIFNNYLFLGRGELQLNFFIKNVFLVIIILSIVNM